MNLYEKYDKWELRELLVQLKEVRYRNSNFLTEQSVYLEENIIRNIIKAVKKLIKGSDDIQIPNDEIDDIVAILDDPNNANLDDASLLDLLDRASPTGPNPGDIRGTIGPDTPVGPGAVGPGDEFVDDWVDMIDNGDIPGDSVIGTIGPGSPGNMGPPNPPEDPFSAADDFFGPIRPDDYEYQGPPDPGNPFNILNYLDKYDRPPFGPGA